MIRHIFTQSSEFFVRPSWVRTLVEKPRCPNSLQSQPPVPDVVIRATVAHHTHAALHNPSTKLLRICRTTHYTRVTLLSQDAFSCPVNSTFHCIQHPLSPIFFHLFYDHLFEIIFFPDLTWYMGSGLSLLDSCKQLFSPRQ